MIRRLISKPRLVLSSLSYSKSAALLMSGMWQLISPVLHLTFPQLPHHHPKQQPGHD